MIFTLCLQLILRLALAQEATPIAKIDSYFNAGVDAYSLELPMSPSETTQGHQSPKVVALLKEAFKKAQATGIAESKFYNEIISKGDCKAIPKKSKNPCRVMLIGHRDYLLKKADLRVTRDRYTVDLKNPLDKSSSIHHFKIERHHWLIEKAEAQEIVDSTQIHPMAENQNLILKKCRYGGLIGWQCNNIAYSLIPMDEATFVVLGKQLSLADSIQTYKIGTEPQIKSPTEKISFKKSQLKNSADGTISMAVIRQNSNKNSVFVREMTVSSFSNSAEAHKIFISKRFLDEGLEFEFKLLQKKLEN